MPWLLIQRFLFPINSETEWCTLTPTMFGMCRVSSGDPGISTVKGNTNFYIAASIGRDLVGVFASTTTKTMTKMTKTFWVIIDESKTKTTRKCGNCEAMQFEASQSAAHPRTPSSGKIVIPENDTWSYLNAFKISTF